MSEESQGAMVLRHGDGNLVEGNVFIGNGVVNTGGIRMIGNYRVWLPPAVKENDGSTGKWQMLAPKADSSCQVFGKNDTLALSSWGDGKTDKNEAYAFNLWRPYSCCSKAGQAFLGAVTF